MLGIFLTAFGVLADLVLISLVLIKNPRSRTNQYLALVIGGVTLWVATNYISNLQTGNPLLWTRLVFVAPVIVAWSFWFLIHQLTDTRVSKVASLAMTLTAAVMSVIVLSPLVAASVSPIANQGGYNVQYGQLYSVFLAYFIAIMLWSFVRLYGHLKHSRHRRRAQARFIFIGSAIATIWALTTNVVLSLVLHTSAYSSYGPIAGVIFAIFLSYAIIRLRFLDIRLVVARSVTYLLLLLVLGVVYTAGSFTVGNVIFPGGSLSTGHQLYDVFLALVLAFTFQPLRRLFEKLTDTFLYKDHYDSQEVINSFTQILVSELDLERILSKSLTALCQSLHIEFGQVVVFHNERVYRVEHFGPLPRRLMVAPELRRLNRSILIADELSAGERKRTLEEHGIRVSLMLSTKEQFVGYLLLGSKLSGDIYSDQDVRVLEIAGSELAVAILNAKSFAEIQEFNMNLQARIDHATNRLRVANRHLKELDHAKDEFISMASHQLRTPLTTIKGYLSMMLEGDAGRMNGNQKQFVGYAFDASERMVNLISDLLNVSRMSAGKFLIQTKPTDMVQMIQDEVRQLQSHAKAKGIALIFEPPVNPLPPVEIDDNKTRQVVMNFIDNAIYYTSVGEVRVVLEQTGDSVRLEVRDSGIGVPQDAKKKLFSKFFRAENAQSVRPDGTGLGLYLAKRVVQDQGGTIIFNSVEGKGSTFGFVLPLNPQPAKHEEKNGRRLADK